MKQIWSWLSTILLTIAGLFFPEYADPEWLNMTFATLGGLVGLVVVAVNGLKALLKYNENSWIHLPKVLAILVSVALSLIGWWMNFGMFADQVVVWWQVLATGFIAAGVSMLWYDISFGELLLQVIGIAKRKRKK